MFQLAFSFTSPPRSALPASVRLEDGRELPVEYHRSDRARRYLLYLRSDRTVRVTMPRRGTEAQAAAFLATHRPWIQRALARLEAQVIPAQRWQAGDAFLFRGETVLLREESRDGVAHACWADQAVPLRGNEDNWRPLIEAHIFALARAELPQRTCALAARHGITVGKVAVRGQSSRWGSCSARGVVSLNWRLIQMPLEVSDYVIIHELMHRREMNHSSRFWAQVAAACPHYRDAEQWLKRHAFRLGM